MLRFSLVSVSVFGIVWIKELPVRMKNLIPILAPQRVPLAVPKKGMVCSFPQATLVSIAKEDGFDSNGFGEEERSSKKRSLELGSRENTDVPFLEVEEMPTLFFYIA